MGSFSFTCAISGLPIAGGDPVRYALLTQNPYTDDNIRCYIHDLWFPRTWPLRAKYNEYGSVEDVEEGAVKNAWLECFKIDLKPTGIGNNSVHDVATSKDMTFDDMLEAVWEGRIYVKREVDLWAAEPETRAAFKLMEEHRKKRGEKLPDALRKKPVPKGVPTLKRVSSTLTKAGFEVNTGRWGEGLLVDVRKYGHVRVRAGTGKEQSLYDVEKLFSRYATIVRAGTGSYASSGELLLCPKPGIEGYHGGRDRKKSGLRIAQMMVREDVWQALSALCIENAWWADNGKDKTVTVEDYRKAAHQTWARLTDKKDKADGMLAGLELERGYTGVFARDPIPFSWGLGSSFKWIARKFRRGEMKDSEVQPFLDSAAEYAFLAQVLGMVRHQWRPSYSNGPQFGEWGMHHQVFEQLTKVAHLKAEEDREERAKYA